MKLLKEEPELVVAGIATVVAAGFAFALLARNDWLTNVGFLVFGALIAVFTTLASERTRRRTQARDLAKALYVELADRVARCCFDAEKPWRAWLTIQACVASNVDSFRLRKFVPDKPIIYESSASELALLGSDIPQALIKFYYRLAAWRRDLENIARAHERHAEVDFESVNLLAQRLRQTLRPGLAALEQMGPHVDGSAGIEASAIAGYDEYRPDERPTGSLRERIKSLLE